MNYGNAWSVCALLILLATASCKQKTAENTEKVVLPKEVSSTKTYAEISVKEGGQWEGKKYVGDDFTFKNVDYLKAPDSLTDHSYYIRYEGPGWESNMVGYRLYLDWRNAIDIFGKKVDTMVLSKVGLDNYDSYHEEASWGQDILKAGQSLGIGSYGRYDGQKKVAHFKEVDSTTVAIKNTPEGSGITIKYYGWKALKETTDLQTELFIEPDSRLTKATLTPSKEIKGLCTGFVKFDGIGLVKREGRNWSYLATYGEQTLVPDQLGMAIFYKKAEVLEIADAEFDHLIVFKPTTQPVTYFFLGAWEQEKNGVRSKDEFFTYINKKLADLNGSTTL